MHIFSCPNLWLRSCSKCYGMDCFGIHTSIHFTHVQTCDYIRVQSATKWTASVPTSLMSKPVVTFVFKVLRNGLLRYILHTCPNLRLRSYSKCYGMDCFGTYLTHAQTCDYVRVQSATEWTASVRTSLMSKPVVTFVFKVLRHGLLRYTYFNTLHTCPNLWLRSCSKCYVRLQECRYSHTQQKVKWLLDQWVCGVNMKLKVTIHIHSLSFLEKLAALF